MKTRVLILITFFLAFALCSAGQEKQVPRFNVEWYCGVMTGMPQEGVKAVPFGLLTGVETRYNFRSTPLNVSIIHEFSFMVRVYEANRKDESIRYYKTLCAWDYNFRRGKAVSMFAGIAAGSAIESDLDSSWQRNVLIFAPRVGLRLFRHVNLSLDYTATRAPNSHFNLRLGYYI
jgi:hypothetical protein